MPNIKDLHSQVIPQGIYFNMPDHIYHADKSISNSGMNNLVLTPKVGITVPTPRKYWWESNFNPEKEPIDSDAMKKGRALHTMVLEPHKFAEQFQIKPNVKTSTVANTLGEGQYKDLKKASQELLKNETAKAILSAGIPEVAIFWIDEETGVPCRLKVDILETEIAADLKTTSNIYDIGYSIVDYGYHRQVAFYLEGINKIKSLIKASVAKIVTDDNNLFYHKRFIDEFVETVHDKFCFIFQEIKAPFLSRCIQLCPDTQANGMQRARQCLEIYKQNYERYGESAWETGFLDNVELITLSDLPRKIDY